MFANPDYRRMGIAKELLHRVVEEARAYGCGAVQIMASNMGVKLYTAYINYLYTNSGKSIEDIEIIVNDSIDNYKKVYYIENHGDPAVAICDDINGMIYVRPSELKIKCKQYMNSLKNTRTK